MIAWLKEMYRCHGERFMRSTGWGTQLMGKFILGHRVYKALQSDPQAWGQAVKDLAQEFGHQAIERFLIKLNEVKPK